jgi:hypothetical protein
MGHRSTEKFCLRWNDFESNISGAFRELREDQDFFDVTLACDDDSAESGDNLVEAHRVVLAACSPFFRAVLRRASAKHHAHPLVYLKGVKHADLLAVLNFMYHGEVNVAQEELNSFLAVAEELKVKGLTQQNGGQTDDRVSGNSSSGSSGMAAPSRMRGRDSQTSLSSAVSDRVAAMSSDGGGGPSAKRPRTASSAVMSTVGAAPSAATLPLVVSGAVKSVEPSGGGYLDEDDIQEVVMPPPVKSEPISSLAVSDNAHALVAPPDDFGGAGGGEEYGEDYADYEGGGGYDGGDGSYEGGGMEGGLGAGASADGNKGRTEVLFLKFQADRNMFGISSNVYRYRYCSGYQHLFHNL